jgi:undecaprenyl-diphosphatase
MDWLQALLLAALQGLTEFLPISSSAHLILLPRLAGWQDQGLAFDVAVHVGSLAAVVVYFRAQLAELWRAWWAQVTQGRSSAEARLAWAVLIATLPVMLIGALVNGGLEERLRDPMVIAAATLVFAVLLWIADHYARHARDEHSLTWRDILIVGCAQALALVPGTSRSGITMTAGLALGLTRSAAARFSFLLSIPVILLAGGLKTAELLTAPQPALWLYILAAAAVSAATAFACIHYFLKLIDRIGMTPFVLYRIGLALLLFYLYS